LVGRSRPDKFNRKKTMQEKTSKIIELCGVSEKSYAEATKNAVA
jgi:hypothetical protein